METTEEQKGDVTLADIIRNVQQHGNKRTTVMLNILGRQRKVYDALKSEIGQIFFREIMPSAENLLIKVMEGEATEEERIEYKILRGLLLSWGSKLVSYEKHKLKFTTDESKENQDD